MRGVKAFFQMKRVQYKELMYRQSVMSWPWNHTFKKDEYEDNCGEDGYYGHHENMYFY